jgi:hypothetical protein
MFVGAQVVAATGIVVALARRLHTWGHSPRWMPAHTLALGGGALVGHSLLWGLTQPATAMDRAVVAMLFVLTLAALWQMWQRLPAPARG